MLKGQKTPIETRRKMSEVAKGKHPSAETLVKLRESHKGNRHPKEVREKISISLKGNKRSFGFKHSIESRRKNSEGHKGLKKSEETKKKMSLASRGRKWSSETRKKYSGANSHSWRGGLSSINEIIRNSLEYKLWRTAVFTRDGYTCIWGGKAHGKKLHADHIKSFSKFPELRFAIDNGRTLCIPCHRTTETYGNKK